MNLIAGGGYGGWGGPQQQHQQWGNYQQQGGGYPSGAGPYNSPAGPTGASPGGAPRPPRPLMDVQTGMVPDVNVQVWSQSHSALY